MRVVILGGGVVGVSAAYELARRGAMVTLLERHRELAAEASFANAGQISPGFASPWASPHLLPKLFSYLLDAKGPLRIYPQLDPKQWSWLLQMLRECTATRYADRKRKLVRLAEYSRDCLRDLRNETRIEYDAGTKGTLELFRNARDLDHLAKDKRVLDELGVPYEILDRAGVVDAEPSLKHQVDKIAGGLRFPNDETGDCRLFTIRLAAMAAAAGAKIVTDCPVERLELLQGRIAAAVTPRQRYLADVFIVALGSYSPILLRPLGLRLPIYPVKGYTATVPLRHAGYGPVSTITDHRYKIALTRLGNRLRIGGTAELSGYNDILRAERLDLLRFVAEDWFPKAVDWRGADYWTCLRPLTPRSTPLLGTTHIPNLWLNTGHGTLGWTMATGSARLLADALEGLRTALPLADYAV